MRCGCVAEVFCLLGSEKIFVCLLSVRNVHQLVGTLAVNFPEVLLRLGAVFIYVTTTLLPGVRGYITVKLTCSELTFSSLLYYQLTIEPSVS